ncbi:hypothetical protein [Vibrio parahaemolyticus]|uniref:hypothetical protein n=1 Tax=Vibrio parahaemolyticus TaxID=670 RepID=UPI0005C5B9B1
MSILKEIKKLKLNDSFNSNDELKEKIVEIVMKEGGDFKSLFSLMSMSLEPNVHRAVCEIFYEYQFKALFNRYKNIGMTAISDLAMTYFKNHDFSVDIAKAQFGEKEFALLENVIMEEMEKHMLSVMTHNGEDGITQGELINSFKCFYEDEFINSRYHVRIKEILNSIEIKLADVR